MSSAFARIAVLALLFSPGVTSAGEIRSAADQIGSTLTNRIDCTRQGSASVGIWPFDEATVPLAPANAERLYGRFLSGLIRASPDCVTFFDADGASATAAYLARVGTLRQAGRRPLDEIESNLQDVDYLVAGTIIEQGGTALASFKLTDRRSGATLRATEPVEVPADLREAACGDGALALSVAPRVIAQRLVDATPRLERIVVEGGFYANSDGKTEFSRYFEELLVQEIASVAHDPITGQSPTIHSLHERGAPRLRNLRGLTVTARDVEEELEQVTQDPRTPDRGSVHRLQFRYWPCGDAVRMSVGLRSREGQRSGWVGSVALDMLPSDIALHPPAQTPAKDWGPDGAFTFQMTSQRGSNPTYRPGERFETLFRLARDAWLYCFYTDSEGSTIQVLPNPFQIGQPRANHYSEGRLHLFPDPERLPYPDPFDLTINAKTKGIEVFRCIATSRDITGELPQALRGQSLDPIDNRYALRLREIFEALEGASISSATMTVTVLE